MPAARLLARIHNYLPEDRALLVKDALEFATAAHQGQYRESEEPYIEHPIATAEFLAEREMDATTLSAALLHDVIEDCDVTREELEERFGEDVARLVDGVTKMKRIDTMSGGNDAGANNLASAPPGDDRAARQAASMRKMLVAMAEDVRVVLIKLADRLHNMKTLEAKSADRRAAIARETLDIYAPLAHRLGAWDLKWRLEDESFRHLQPREYRMVSRMLARKRGEREAYVERVKAELQGELERAGIDAEIYGRPKHLYSIYQKMQRYAAQGRKFNEIYDLIALRVIVSTEAECYTALGIVHGLWRPVPGQFDDYIASPKQNLYQSLHTSIMCLDNYPVEVQIRTKRMHEIAENGVAAHWAYKEHPDDGRVEASDRDGFEQRMSWLRQLLEWQRELKGDTEYLDTVRTDILRDQVYVYTPRGEVKELPAGATPLDFAYHIHTDLGHQTVSAVVNGKLVALNTPLQTGDTVEIRKSRTTRGPSMDWLNPDLGYLVTASAREKARQWFRRQKKEENIQRGRSMLRREMRHLSLARSDDEIARLMGYDNPEELANALGSGALSTADLARGLSHTLEPSTPQPENGTNGNGDQFGAPRRSQGDGAGDDEIVVIGENHSAIRAPVRRAKCCVPQRGDEIIGYVTRGRGVTVHLKSCPNLRTYEEPERLTTVAWGQSGRASPARLRIEGWDRVGLLHDITSIVSSENINIRRISSVEHPWPGRSIVTLTVYTSGTDQLSRLCTRIEAIPGVHSVATEGAEGKPEAERQSVS